MIIVRFLWALFKFIKSGCAIVSEHDRKKRLFTCYACEDYDRDLVRCKVCGCFLVLKTWCAKEECPNERWEARNENDQDTQMS